MGRTNSYTSLGIQQGTSVWIGLPKLALVIEGEGPPKNKKGVHFKPSPICIINVLQDQLTFYCHRELERGITFYCHRELERGTNIVYERM